MMADRWGTLRLTIATLLAGVVVAVVSLFRCVNAMA